MNRIVIFATALLSFGIARSQSAPPSDSFMLSRQVEVERLAETLYLTRLDSGKWARHSVPRCESFTHHSFASFDASTANGARFVAIYDRDHATARSPEKPWEGGIKLFRLKTPSGVAVDADLGSDALLTAFNLAVSQENAARHSAMDPADEAICFLSISAEEPAITSTQENTSEIHSTAPVKIASILIPLAGGPGTGRMASLEFGANGAIVKASIAQQHRR